MIVSKLLKKKKRSNINKNILKTFYEIAMKYKHTILTVGTASIVSVGSTYPGISGERQKRDCFYVAVESPEVKVSEGGSLAVSEERVSLSADVGSPEVKVSEDGSLAVSEEGVSLSADVGSPVVKVSEDGSLAVSEKRVSLSADVGSPVVKVSEDGSLAVSEERVSLSADVEEHTDSSDVEISVDFDLGFNIFGEGSEETPNYNSNFSTGYSNGDFTNYGIVNEDDVEMYDDLYEQLHNNEDDVEMNEHQYEQLHNNEDDVEMNEHQYERLYINKSIEKSYNSFMVISKTLLSWFFYKLIYAKIYRLKKITRTILMKKTMTKLVNYHFTLLNYRFKICYL